MTFQNGKNAQFSFTENLLRGQKPNPELRSLQGNDPDFKELPKRVLNLQIPLEADQPCAVKKCFPERGTPLRLEVVMHMPVKEIRASWLRAWVLGADGVGLCSCGVQLAMWLYHWEFAENKTL